MLRVRRVQGTVARPQWMLTKSQRTSASTTSARGTKRGTSLVSLPESWPDCCCAALLTGRVATGNRMLTVYTLPRKASCRAPLKIDIQSRARSTSAIAAASLATAIERPRACRFSRAFDKPANTACGESTDQGSAETKPSISHTPALSPVCELSRPFSPMHRKTATWLALSGCFNWWAVKDSNLGPID